MATRGLSSPSSLMDSTVNPFNLKILQNTCNFIYYSKLYTYKASSEMSPSVWHASTKSNVNRDSGKDINHFGVTILKL